MYRITRLEQALRVLTAAFMLVAVGALLWQPAVPAEQTPPAGLNVPQPVTPPAGGDPVSIESIVAANIFSAARAAPATRYQPLAVEAGSDAPVVDAAPPATDPEAGVPRLYGIVAGPHGAAALLRLDAGAPAAQLLREGESSGRYRVVKINEQSVVLTGPAGRVELRLIRPEG